VNARGRLLGAFSRELHVVYQAWDNDCGPAALATVVACHGCSVDYGDFSSELAPDRHGTDLLTLARTAERLGLRAEGVKASYDAIPGCTLPAIAHLRRRVGSGHFVVIHRWTPTHVVVTDPARGLRRVSRRAFCRRSTGYLLLIQPSGKATVVNDRGSVTDSSHFDTQSSSLDRMRCLDSGRGARRPIGSSPIRSQHP